MDKETIIEMLDKILSLWKKPVDVGFSEKNREVTVLYETIIKTEKLYNKLPEKIKKMTIFAPKEKELFYDVEKFENADFDGNDDLLIDKDASLSDIIPNLIKAKSLYKERSYFRDRWWGSPLNLQGQIKFVLENLKPKVRKEYSYQSEREITLGGRRKRRRRRRRKSRKKKRKTKRTRKSKKKTKRRRKRR
mgnify:CR=1 FL=1